MEPWIKDSVEYYQHQADGVRELANRRSFILADDMGLGKTLTALTTFAVDVARGWAKTCVIVAPPTLKGNWQDEIEKFTGFPCVVLDGPPEVRTIQMFNYMMIQGPKILIMNYEHAYGEEKWLSNQRFDIAIFDEAHYIKNPRAKRTIAVLNVRSRRSFLLTGTPFLNQVNEFWCLLHRIDPARFPRYETFLNRYCVLGEYGTVVGPKNEQELTEILHSYMLRRMKEDCIDLPEVLSIERRVDLYHDQREIYDQISDELKYVNLDGEEEEINNTLTKFLRLKQVCGTLLSFTGEDRSAKLDLAVEDDQEVLREGRKVVTFTQSRYVQAAYEKRLKALGVPVFTINGDVPQIDRPKIVKEAGKVEGPVVLTGILRVAAEGLNMTWSRDMNFLDKDYTPGKMDQALDRCRRIGADVTQPITVRNYICRGTVENRIEEILRTKRKLFESVVNDPARKRELLKLVLENEE